MHYPAITACYAAALTIIYAVLTLRVAGGRGERKIPLGDGGNPELLTRIRTHANFSEYVPLALVLIALLEAGGTWPILVHALCLLLVFARLIHPWGMTARPGTAPFFIGRGAGSCITLLVMLIAAILIVIYHWPALLIFSQ